MKLFLRLFIFWYLLLAFALPCHDERGFWLPIEACRAVEFQKRLEYHGLQYDVWVIRSDERGRYWIDNQGRHCRFD